MLLYTLTYTLVAVKPLTPNAAFKLPSTLYNMFQIVNESLWLSLAGCTFVIELLLGWNVAFVVTHNLRKRVVLRRSKIIKYYVWNGSFIFDFISTCVFIAQVTLQLRH